MSDLLRRTITGVFIVIFTLGGFWLHPISFFITGFVIIAGSVYEYYKLMRRWGVNPQMIPGIAICITAYSIATLVASSEVGYGWFLLLVPMITGIMIYELYRRQERPFDSLSHTLFPLLYIALPVSLMPFAAFGHTGISTLLPQGKIVFSPGMVIGFLLLLWINDTAAYLAGVTLGRHRLFERISPKKSWEGFAGGLILSAITAWLIPQWLGIAGKLQWIAAAVIVSVAGTYGDLIESMLKRSIGIKDSGSIMPGHGGFLDRFDSVMISFPLFFIYLSLFG